MRTLPLKLIAQSVAEAFDLSEFELKHTSRKSDTNLVRQCAFFLAREFSSASYKVISEYFGCVDHSAASNGARVFASKKIDEFPEGKREIALDLFFSFAELTRPIEEITDEERDDTELLQCYQHPQTKTPFQANL